MIRANKMQLEIGKSYKMFASDSYKKSQWHKHNKQDMFPVYLEKDNRTMIKFGPEIIVLYLGLGNLPINTVDKNLPFGTYSNSIERNMFFCDNQILFLDVPRSQRCYTFELINEDI